MFLSVLSRIIENIVAYLARQQLKMGIDPHRFRNLVFSEQLSCPICKKVYEDPRQDRDEHVFCFECISDAIRTTSKCPIDGNSLTIDDIHPVPKFLTEILSNL